METIKKHSNKEIAVSNPDTIIPVEQLLRDKEMLTKLIANSQTSLDRINFLLGEAKKLKVD